MLRLAAAKAAAVAHPGELVLGADTVVVLDGLLLGKPRDPDDAARMLAAIAGREHTVLTGVALCEPGGDRQAAELETSRVRMAALTAEEVAWYVATGEPLDKAGSYAVQGSGRSSSKRSSATTRTWSACRCPRCGGSSRSWATTSGISWVELRAG